MLSSIFLVVHSKFLIECNRTRMFLEYFIRAREYLSQQGLKPALVMGTPVSENDLKALDKETDFPMPTELRHFYLELGDGFAFLPDDSEGSELVGWDYMHLADHKIWNKGFGGAIEDEAMRKIGEPVPRTSPQLLKQEIAKRKRWMPFYGFVGGGDVLCLDLNTSPPAVRFYEALVWVVLPDTWWSRYHFLSPSGAWTSFCRERSGQFNWTSEHFPQVGGQRWNFTRQP